MAKSDPDELVSSKKSSSSGSSSGSSGSSGSGGRRFPWRLWMWTIAMTAGAVAGAYYTWHYRGERNTAEDQQQTCRTDLDAEKKKTTELDTKKKQLDDCAIKLGDEKKKADGYQALNASQAMAPAPAGSDANQRAEADKRNAVIDAIQKQLAKTPQVTVGARRGALVLSLSADALFTGGTAELTEPGKATVHEVAFAAKQFADRRFLVTGYTDDAVIKSATFKDNLELSVARAVAVARALVLAGVDARNLIAGGAGENDPIAKDAAKSRRIEVALLPSAGELVALPAALGADTAKADAPAPAPTAPTPTPGAAPAPAAPTATPTPAPAAPTATPTPTPAPKK